MLKCFCMFFKLKVCFCNLRNNIHNILMAFSSKYYGFTKKIILIDKMNNAVNGTEKYGSIIS